MAKSPIKNLTLKVEGKKARKPKKDRKSPKAGLFCRRAAAADAANANAEKPAKQPGPLRRAVDKWWNRLIAAVFGGQESARSEQYLAHQTTRDYVLNTCGQAAWGALFPLLTMVCTWIVGAEKAGLFSMAFTIGTLLLFLANFGTRTYQVSDIDEMQSFADYQVHRAITCAAMLLVGYAYCRTREYADPMMSICMGVLTFRAVDGLADVYEGRLQQKDKLYLAGLSQGVRCAGSFVAFSAVLLLTRNLAWASWGMAIAAVGSLLVLKIPKQSLSTRLLALILTLVGVGSMIYTGTSFVAVAAVGQAVTGTGFGALAPVRTTLMQQRCEPGNVGRVSSIMRMGMNSAGTVPLLVSPALADAFGPQAVLFGASTLAALIGLAFALRAQDGKKGVGRSA